MMNGDIWWIDFGIPFGSETGFRRPAVIVQSDLFNCTSMDTTIVIPLTSNLRLADFPGNMLLPAEITGLSKDSVAVTPQITAIDKTRVVEKVKHLPASVMLECAENIKLLLGI